MAGYKGYSMSNNAVSAYENGEKPYSRWTKAAIISELEKDDSIPQEVLQAAQGMPAAELKNVVLMKSSWHHTSAKYNLTDFYTVNPERLISYMKEQKAKENIVSARCRVCIGWKDNGDCIYEYRVLQGYETEYCFVSGGNTYIKGLDYELITEE